MRPTLRLVKPDENEPIPFPGTATTPPSGASEAPDESVDSIQMALQAMEDVSRRMNHLARELNCLGWFDDEDGGGPRAA